jgi:hypothetical protein
MNRGFILGVGVVTLLLAGCGGTTIPLAPGAQGGGTSTGQASEGGGGQAVGGGAQAGAGIEMAEVAGDWLGPAPGDTGSCGSSYAEWQLEQDGAYYVTDNSEDCGGFTASGGFQIQGSSLDFAQESSTCGDCGAADFSVTVSFSSLDEMEMCDVPADGICYTYARQSG